MKKYKLKKLIPGSQVGDVVNVRKIDKLYMVFYPENDDFKFSFKTENTDISEWFEEIPEKTKSVWDLIVGDTFYLSLPAGAEEFEWTGEENKLRWRDSGLIFLTKDEAEQFYEKAKAISRVKKYIHDNGMEFEPDWEDLETTKYWISYDNLEDVFDYSYSYRRHHNPQLPILKSTEDCKKVIENCEPELRIIFGIK